MNFRTTIILVLILLGVGAYVLFTNREPVDTTEKKNPEHILDIASGDVTRLIITPADGKSIVLEKVTTPSAAAPVRAATSDWKLTSPYTAPADAMKSAELLDAVLNATSTAQVNIEGKAASYGLDTPQFKVEVVAKNKDVKLDIGRLEKAGNELYVQVEGKNVAEVIGGDLLDKVDVSPDSLRLTRLIDLNAAEVNHVDINRPKDAISLTKSGSGWEMTLPTTRPTDSPRGPVPAETTAVADLVSTLNNALATGFADAGDNVSLLVGDPQATVTVTAAPPTTQPSNKPADSISIAFGSSDSLIGKNVWIRVTPPGVVAKVSKETMDGVLKSSLDLRSREVVKIDPVAVTEIRIVKTSPPTTQPTTREAMRNVMILARRKKDLQAGPPAPVAIAPPTRPTTSPTTTASSTTEPATKPAVVVTKLSEWQLVSPVKADADDAKVAALLAELSPLHTTKYVPPATQPSAPSPLAAPITYTVTVTSLSGTPVNMVFVDPGEVTAQPIIGTYDGLNFEVARTLITALDADFAKATKP